jgi:hypothetical protein
MTAHDDLDRQLNDLLRDGPEELPYQSFDAVRDRTELTRQRVVIGPWRLPEMNKIVTIGLGAAAVVLAVVVGAQLFGSPGSGTGGPGGGPTATPGLTATPEPTATVEPSASPVSAPVLDDSFTSAQHGYSVAYPSEWTTEAAVRPWTDATFPLSFAIPQVDFLYPPIIEEELFLAVASQPIGDSSPDAWLADQMASGEGCGTDTAPITIDGASGLVGTDGCTVAVVTTAGRGYWIQLYTGDEAPEFDHAAWFGDILATVRLHPENAADVAASAAP